MGPQLRIRIKLPMPLAPAMPNLLLTTRSGWSELAVVPLLLHTLSPTDTATLMLALTLLPLAQPRPSRVWRSSQLFRAARTCLATLPLRRTLVDAQMRLVRLRLLPGAAVRLSSLSAQRPPATPKPARMRRSKGRSGCFPQPDFLSVLAVVGVSSCYKRGSGTCDASHFPLIMCLCLILMKVLPMCCRRDGQKKKKKKKKKKKIKFLCVDSIS